MVPRSLLLVLVLAVTGCVNSGSSTALVSTNPFDSTPVAPPATRASFAPASTEAAARVDTLGRKIVAANPQMGLRPIFLTIGTPQPEIFHRGMGEVDITEGLVKQCLSDGQLAAVLCHELGKMVSEREALAGPKARSPERPPPMDVPIGNDTFGGTPDLTHLAEQAKYDRERHSAASSAPLLPPDPNLLARSYLRKAQFAENELENAAPLLTAAATNFTLEKQLVTPPPARPWTH